MTEFVKIFNKTVEKHMVCLHHETEPGKYTVMLTESDAFFEGYDTWIKHSQGGNIFTLEMHPRNANLVLLGEQDPSKPNGSAVAWAAELNIASPIELIYNARDESIVTNAGSVSQHLTSIQNGPYVYFTGTSTDRWEIQYL